ncbi:MAG: gamma-butyrobetaine hydroxylase-like domain-containing protein [Parashewanella sp.]
MNTTPNVTNLTLKKKSRVLQISFSDGSDFELSCEFLRVHSPSAEVQGHGTPTLVQHKKLVNISSIEPVGHYGVKLVFDDGHDTGIYSWSVLYHLATHYDELWQNYLKSIAINKGSREALISMAVKYTP